MSVTVPSSTWASSPSCWARLKRWISSMNRSVSAGAPPRLGLLVHLAQVGHPGHHRRELHERLTQAPREQARERGLAGAGRPHRMIEPSCRARTCARAACPGRADGPGRPAPRGSAAAAGRRAADRRVTARGRARGLGSREQVAHPPITTASLRPARSISSRQAQRVLLQYILNLSELVDRRVGDGADQVARRRPSRVAGVARSTSSTITPASQVQAVTVQAGGQVGDRSSRKGVARSNTSPLAAARRAASRAPPGQG